MTGIRDAANDPFVRAAERVGNTPGHVGGSTASRVGKAARSMAVKAAKTSAIAAVVKGAAKVKKSLAEADPATKRRRRKIAAVVAGAAALTAVGVAVSRTKAGKNLKDKVVKKVSGKSRSGSNAGVSTTRLKKSVAQARKRRTASR